MDGFQRRREQKKLDILAAALQLFLEHGLERVSIAMIAKEAGVSQVTLYNYYQSKQNLIQAVLIFYVDQEWLEFEKLVHSDLTFHEIIKQMFFDKKSKSNAIHPDFYQHFMEQYNVGIPYFEHVYNDKMLPALIELFNRGKEQGYVDHRLSNQTIIFYLQLLKEAMQRDGIYQAVLPMTEELMNIIVYGLVGNREG